MPHAHWDVIKHRTVEYSSATCPQELIDWCDRAVYARVVFDIPTASCRWSNSCTGEGTHHNERHKQQGLAFKPLLIATIGYCVVSGHAMVTSTEQKIVGAQTSIPRLVEPKYHRNESCTAYYYIVYDFEPEARLGGIFAGVNVLTELCS